MIDQRLFDRVQEPATVRAGLIGVGQFGAPIVTQVPVVAGVDVAAGQRAFRLAGVAPKDIALCESRAEALRALEQRKGVNR